MGGRITNLGLITGNVDLGFGNDVFDGRGGKVNGVLDGGKGTDLYQISDFTIATFESSGLAGFNSIETSVDHSLINRGSIELMTRVGAGVGDTGNKFDSHIEGGTMDNVLSEGVGSDVLVGFVGQFGR